MKKNIKMKDENVLCECWTSERGSTAAKYDSVYLLNCVCYSYTFGALMQRIMCTTYKHTCIESATESERAIVCVSFYHLGCIRICLSFKNTFKGISLQNFFFLTFYSKLFTKHTRSAMSNWRRIHTTTFLSLCMCVFFYVATPSNYLRMY